MRYAICLGLLSGCQMPNPAFGEGVDDGNAAEADTRASGDVDGDSGTEASSTNSDASSSSEADTTGDATDTTDTTEPCSAGLLLCDGGCVEPSTDPLNCGDCNVMCDAAQICVDGQCSHIKRVFITSVPLAANLQGLDAASYYCNLLAGSGQLPGTYKAWLSTPNSWPGQVFTQGGAYVRTDDVLVAKNWEDLIDGSLQAPIDVTEFGVPVVGSAACGVEAIVWTSTTPGGLWAGAPDCNGWTAADVSANGQVGDAHAIDGTWSLVGGCQVSCAAPLPVYCIEQ